MKNDYKTLYQKEKSFNKALQDKYIRLEKILDTYQIHLNVIEKEFVEVKNRLLNIQIMDQKFNVYGPSAFENMIIQKSKLSNKSFVLVIIDLDDFKKINDTYGHHIGDLAISWFAQILKKTFREEIDIIGRYGGDEFVILIDDIALKNVKIKVNKLLKYICSNPFCYENIKISINASAGLTKYNNKIDINDITLCDVCHELSKEEEINHKIYRANFIKADEHLYNAKRNGKNQCSS